MQNQPIVPTERENGNEGIISRFYNQPSDDQLNEASIPNELQPETDVLYECNFCNASFSKVHNLREHEKKRIFLLLFFAGCASKI